MVSRRLNLTLPMNLMRWKTKFPKFVSNLAILRNAQNSSKDFVKFDDIMKKMVQSMAATLIKVSTMMFISFRLKKAETRIKSLLNGKNDRIDIDLQTISLLDAIRVVGILKCNFDKAGVIEFLTSLQKMTARIEKDKDRFLRSSSESNR